jgi:chlorite dismutase
MKSITLSADEELIEQARFVARAHGKTLSVAFREWLVEFAAQAENVRAFEELMKRLRYVKAGRRYTRGTK